MQILTVAALIVIGILLFELIIFSHEFGHFITAKLSGVKVNEFALGMGPKIVSFVKGETRYSLRLFPIGGYCAMEGEDEDSEEKGAFNNAKVWKRMIIIIAGAVMNILLGFVMMFAFTVQADSYSSTTISQFQPNAFTANTGLQTGDKIVEVNGYSIWNSRDLQFAISTLPYETVEGNTLEVYKERATSAACGVYNKYAKDESLSKDELQKYYNALSEGCSKINKAASKDEAKKLLDETCKSIYALDKSYDMSKYKTPEIDTTTSRPRFMGDVKVVRDGKEITLENVQFFTYYADEDAEKENKPTVAFDFAVEPIEKNIGTVLGETFTQTCSMAKTVWTSLVWLVQGRFTFNDMSGPVGIATAVTQVASMGLQTGFVDAVNNILFVMILITVNLGIVNMLPFPALDGGRFLFLLIEWIFKKPIPRKAEQIVNTVGLVLLLAFMLIISVKDIEGSVRQAKELEAAGCEIIRAAIPNKDAVKLIPALKEAVSVPIVADIHFDYKLALEACAAGIDKIRINPGNIGSDDRVKAVADACRQRGIPIRIGVNSGSLEKEILAKYGHPTPEALCDSALYHASLLEKFDFNDIVLSMKSSTVSTMIKAYELAAERCDYPLHLGVTEAGTERMGIIKSSAGIGALLLHGIGDTIRVSLTADPVKEVYAAHDILKALDIEKDGVQFVSCPTCGRTRIDLVKIANEVEDKLRNCKKNIKVAVMGCVVNGPGEAREADIGIAGGDGCGLVFKKGEILRKVPEDKLVDALLEEVEKL